MLTTYCKRYMMSITVHQTFWRFKLAKQITLQAQLLTVVAP